MVDVSEIAKMDSEKLEKVQSVIALFHLLGITDEEIALLPQVLKNWPTIVSNMNGMTKDMVEMKNSIARLKPRSENKGEPDDATALQNMVGFDSSIEKVSFNRGR